MKALCTFKDYIYHIMTTQNNIIIDCYKRTSYALLAKKRHYSIVFGLKKVRNKKKKKKNAVFIV